MLKSISPATLESYQRYWKTFHAWFSSSRNGSKVSIPLICDFLVYMFEKGYTSSSLNCVRSALSLLCPKDLDIGNNPHISRLFRSFYIRRPKRSKYVVSWPVEKFLEFLASWHPANSLNLRQLTLKTLALIALSSSDRGQTLHALNIENTHLTAEGVEFVIFTPLKTTHIRRKPKVVKCLSTQQDELNVAAYTLSYMNRTIPMRAACVKRGIPKPTNLFLSWKTKLPASRQSILRWLKLILKISNVTSENYSGHSFRGSGLSYAFHSGASIHQILEAGNWTNVKTFNNHYNNPDESSPVGKIILNQLKVRCSRNICFL